MADYRQTRKQAWLVLLIWALAAAWTVTVSFALAGSSATWLGIPLWAAAGVLAPWLVFFGVHAWFSLVRLERDADD